MDIVQITDRILVSIGIGIIGRIVVRKSINHNGQCFGQYITDSFSDKEQGTESKPLPFTDIFTGIYIVYLFL